MLSEFLKSITDAKLTAREALLLNALDDAGPARLNALTGLVGGSKQVNLGSLKRLVMKGLVTYTASKSLTPNTYRLTDKGSKLCKLLPCPKENSQ